MILKHISIFFNSKIFLNVRMLKHDIHIKTKSYKLDFSGELVI